MPTQKQIKNSIVRQLISKATPAELILRTALSKTGIKFVFQRPFRTRDRTRQVKGGGHEYTQKSQLFVADFYMPEYATIIEIDGSIHNKRYHHDQKRQHLLIHDRKMIKYFLRFTNNDIAYRLNKVIDTILKLKPVRLIQLKDGQYLENHNNNKELARLNEIEFIIQNDQDTQWYTKRELVKQIYK